MRVDKFDEFKPERQEAELRRFPGGREQHLLLDEAALQLHPIRRQERET